MAAGKPQVEPGQVWEFPADGMLVRTVKLNETGGVFCRTIEAGRSSEHLFNAEEFRRDYDYVAMLEELGG